MGAMVESGRVVRFLAAAVGALALSVALWRIRLGIDFTDEAFYVGLPFRFALGDRPFVDELNVTQTAGLFVYPFVKAYVTIVGDATGIFLPLRFMFVLFFAGVGVTAYRLAVTRLPRPAAFLVAVPCLCFIPYCLPSLSYNTLGTGFFAMGVFVIGRWAMGPPSPLRRFPRDPLFWAGLAHGAAAFAYPPFAPAVVLAGLAIAPLAPGARHRALLRYVVGGLAFAALVSPLLLSAGAVHLREVMTYSGMGNLDPDQQRLSVMVKAFGVKHPQLPLGVLSILLAVALARKWPTLAGITLPFLPLLACGFLPHRDTQGMAFVSCFALYAPLFAVALRDRRTAGLLLVCIWLPSICAGTLAGWSSTNGPTATALGFFPGAILSAMLLTAWICETAEHSRLTWLRPAMVLAPAVVTLVLLRYELAADAVYRDDPLPSLTERVSEGPYKGLYTTPARKAGLAFISADIRDHVKGDRALFYYDFPAGYLIANRRPLVASAWIFPIPGRSEFDARYFRARARPGDLVFRLAGQAPMPLDGAVDQRSDLIALRSAYSLHLVRADAGTAR